MSLDWSDSALEQRMREGWYGGLKDGTPCGGGSTQESAKAVLMQLPGLVRDYKVTKICDAGAGDLHWIRPNGLGCDYEAFDLLPRHPRVKQLDITKYALPACDVILCRHVLIHLDPARIVLAIQQFSKSAKYLLASQYDDAPQFDASLQYNPTDLRPLLGEPLERLTDTGSDLALWEL